MKKLIFSLFFSLVFISVVNIAKAQNAKSNFTVAEAKADKISLELELTKAQLDILVNNYTKYYKDIMEISTLEIVANNVTIKIKTIKPENYRIIKRLLITSDIKEIEFKDKKISIDDFFGF